MLGELGGIQQNVSSNYVNYFKIDDGLFSKGKENQEMTNPNYLHQNIYS